MSERRTVRVIDSHTGGEPTRVVIEGGPDLPPGPLQARLEAFRAHHDTFRSAVVNEPRGSDTVVGALLCEPTDPTCAAGVIFFNNVGYLGMCGHGTIGLLATLAHLGRVGPGGHRVETPVGVVTATLHDPNTVTVRNVASYRVTRTAVDVEGFGRVTGDVAWGGNWFFLVDDHGLEISLGNLERLTDVSWKMRQAVNRQLAGRMNGEVDHVELFGPPTVAGAHSKNFVLCPGKAYDRSPCGTGTSAKLACLVDGGKFGPGDVWVQESLIGSVFEGTVDLVGGETFPSIKGTAYVNAEATLILDGRDPFCYGIRG